MTDYSDPLDQLVADPVAFARQAAGTVGIERRLREQEAELRAQRVERALDSDPVLRDRWRKVNSDRAFLDWLSEIHEFSGESRLNLLRRAERYGNTIAIVAMFKSYVLEGMHGRIDNTPLPYQNAPRTPAASGSTRRWRRSEISAFYDAARKGQYSDAERVRLEADILAAARENRIADPPEQFHK